MAWWTRRRALVVGAFAVVVVGGVTWAALASQPGPTPLARSATPSASASGPVCDAQFSVTKQWEGGYQGEVTVTAWAPLAHWQVALNLEGATVSASWDSTLAVGATGLATAANLTYNGTLAAGQASCTITVQVRRLGSSAIVRRITGVATE